MKRIKESTRIFFSILAAGCLTVFGSAYAQEQNPTQAPPQNTPQMEVTEDFSDETIQTFINANEKIMEVQKAAEEKMIQAIEEQNIDMNRFNEILMSRQDPSQETDASPEELAAFSKAAEKVMEVQKEVEEKAIQAIEDEGMAMEQYQQIMVSYQQSPKVQQQVEKLMNEQNAPETSEGDTNN